MVVVIASGVLMVMLRLAVAELGIGVLLSITSTTKLDDPAAVGVPEITPEFEFKVRPVGRDPEEMLHTYGRTPDSASRACA